MSLRGLSGVIGQGQHRNLDRIIRADELQQLAMDAMRNMLKAAIALPVADDVVGIFNADRQGGWCPQFVGLVVTDVEDFPGESLTGSFDQGVNWFSRLLPLQVQPLPDSETIKPNSALATTFTHGVGVQLPLSSMTTYSHPLAPKPPSPLKNSSAGISSFSASASFMGKAFGATKRLVGRGMPQKLFSQAATFADHNHARDCLHQ